MKLIDVVFSMVIFSLCTKSFVELTINMYEKQKKLTENIQEFTLFKKEVFEFYSDIINNQEEKLPNKHVMVKNSDTKKILYALPITYNNIHIIVLKGLKQ